MATYTIRTSSVQDWRDTAMSKAQFEALAAERRTNRAGSGFDEWGKYYTPTSTILPVNEGIWTAPTIPNEFRFGRWNNTYTGISKTESPYANINGVLHKIEWLSSSDTDNRNKIILPSAPTIFPYGTTLTPEQIAMGCVTHADASNSGLIVNGKFDTDTSGWTTIIAGSSITTELGWLKVEQSTGDAGRAEQIISTVVGKSYTLEADLKAGTVPVYIRVANSSNASIADSTIISSTSSTRVTITFTATQSTHKVWVILNSTTDNTFAYADNIAVFPADAISRSDLVFLESWHEDVSEKDFVYPLGNVQYLGTTGDCGTPIAGAFSGSGTYSLFGNWQASGTLIGKGYVWSTLSDANKKAFVANPENNCYLDGDKVIQVRYRMRVVAGMGDSWYNANSVYNSWWLAPSSAVGGTIKTRGKQTSNADYITSSYYEGSFGGTASQVDELGILPQGDYGIFGAINSTVISTQSGYNGKCYALPIALVHRRNQGAYHPVYNANGASKNWDTTATSSKYWYESTARVATSIANSFTEYYTPISLNYGKIGTLSGRPDGLFYDQIHEGDITDLRMSSQKVEDYNRLIDREFNKLVAGTYRGTEGEFEIVSFVGNLADGGSGFKAATFKKNINSATHVFIINHTKATSGASRFLKGDWIQQSLVTGSNLYANYGEYTGAVASILNTVNFNGAQHSIGDSVTIYASIPSTRTKSNILTHTDIIGSPANYPTAWKQSGVSGIPLIVSEDGTSLLPTGSLATFKLSRKFISTSNVFQLIKSSNSGGSWTYLTYNVDWTFNSTANTITLLGASIPSANDLIMVTYQTHTSMAVPAVNSEVLAIGDASAHNHLTFGQLTQTLLNKVSVGATTPVSQFGMKTERYRIDGTTFKFSTISDDSPTHPMFSIAGGTAVPAVKTFPYLTRSNGKAYLNLVFKEMKYNGTSWGDNNKFNIVDNVSTTTDDNGATVLIGQKRVELPYFIGQGE